MIRSFIILLVMLVVCACTERAPRAKPLVLVTIKPLELIVREIVGDSVEVRTLLPAGADPHHYEPTPSDIGLLQGARMFLWTAPTLDGWLMDHAGPNSYELLGYLPLEELRSTSSQPVTASNYHTVADPHFWTTPHLAQNAGWFIGTRLSADDGPIEPLQGSNTFKRKALELDKWAAQQLIVAKGKAVIQTHDSLGYMLEQYGIRCIGVIEVTPEVEPSPKYVSNLIAEAKREHAACVLSEAGHSTKVARLIADECDIPVVELDPEALSTKRRYASYEEWFKWNVNTLAEALK